MMVWKMIFLFNWVIFRFHVILPGCISPSYRTPCGGWLQYQYIFSCGSLKTKKHGARFLVPMAFLVGILCLLLCNFLHHQANTRKVALSTSNVYTNIYKYILYMLYIYIMIYVYIYIYIYVCVCFASTSSKQQDATSFNLLRLPGTSWLSCITSSVTMMGNVSPSWQKKNMRFSKKGAKDATICGCFRKWWYPQNTSKWSFLVGKSWLFGTTIVGNPHM